MLSASCSIETRAFTRRTLDWLRTSLLKGMSREGDSVIFWTFVICILHDGPLGDSLLAFNPSRKNGLSFPSCGTKHHAASCSSTISSTAPAEAISGTKPSR